MGMQFGLRGGEYVSIELSHLTHGVFPDGHAFAGLKWFGLCGLEDKTMKLTAHNNFLQCDESFMRSPVIPGDMLSVGGIIKRFIKKLSPAQTRLFCYPFTAEERILYVKNGKLLCIFFKFL